MSIIKKLLGTKPSQVPRNRDLGTMAYQDASGVNIQGGLVRGEGGVVSAPNNTATTIITLPNVRAGCWIVNIFIETDAAATWSSTYLVNTQASSVVITALRAGSGSGFVLTNSSLALQAAQGSGATQIIGWSALRIL